MKTHCKTCRFLKLDMSPDGKHTMNVCRRNPPVPIPLPVQLQDGSQALSIQGVYPPIIDVDTYFCGEHTEDV